MTYTRSQNYTNMVVGKHGIQTFKVAVVVVNVVVVWCLCSPQMHIPYCFWTGGLSKIYLNVNLYSFESVPFNYWHGSRVVHFTMHPIVMSFPSFLLSILDKQNKLTHLSTINFNLTFTLRHLDYTTHFPSTKNLPSVDSPPYYDHNAQNTTFLGPICHIRGDLCAQEARPTCISWFICNSYIWMYRGILGNLVSMGNLEKHRQWCEHISLNTNILSHLCIFIVYTKW